VVVAPSEPAETVFVSALESLHKLQEAVAVSRHMASQSSGERDTGDKRQLMLQYLFWTVVAVTLGYVVIFVL
jgi:hypothetical protein